MPRTRVGSSSSSTPAATADAHSSLATSSGVCASRSSASTDCSSRTNASADSGRASGCRDMARRSTSSSRSGTSARPVGRGRARWIRATRSAGAFCPPGTSNGLRPASSEYTVAASDHTPLRTVPGLSSASTSGADHGIERPTASVAAASSSVEAMPKSLSTGCPNAVVRMFAGLMSRCSTPARWAVSTALAMRIPTRSTSATPSGSRRYRSLRLDEHSSITRYGRPSAATDAWCTVSTDGWALSCAMRSASARNMARRRSVTISASITFTATWRRGMSCS